MMAMLTAFVRKVRKPARASRRSGFTMIELLVVMAILGVLAGLVSLAAVRLLRGADATERSAMAGQMKTAIAAYRNANNNEWPVDFSGQVSASDDSIRFGTVNNSNRVQVSNVEFIMPLLGRDASGNRDETMRAYIEDVSMLYVCDGNSAPRKLSEELANGSISANDMIGFPITMRETQESRYSDLSGMDAFAPIRIEILFDIDDYEVTIPSDGDFRQVLKIN